MADEKFEVKICLPKRRGGSAASAHRLSVGLARKASKTELRVKD